MDRHLLVVLTLVATTLCTRAANVDALYFTPKNGAGPKVVDALTGTVVPVYEAADGKKPADCPPEGYWSAQGALFRCKDDFKYFLVSPADASAYPAGALILKSSDPGTDDPGPSAPKAN